MTRRTVKFIALGCALLILLPLALCYAVLHASLAGRSMGRLHGT